MKKDRNCMGGNMSMPMYQQGIPVMPMPQPIPTPYQNYQTNNYGGIEQQITMLQQQVNMLEERVNKLEGKNTSNYSNKYNDSNYYML